MIDPIDHPIDLCYGINACNMKENVGYPKKTKAHNGIIPRANKTNIESRFP